MASVGGAAPEYEPSPVPPSTPSYDPSIRSGRSLLIRMLESGVSDAVADSLPTADAEILATASIMRHCIFVELSATEPASHGPWKLLHELSHVLFGELHAERHRAWSSSLSRHGSHIRWRARFC